MWRGAAYVPKGTGNPSTTASHRFFLGKNSKVLYLEKHIGIGEGRGGRIINPQTYVEAGEDSYMEMETTQIKGVDSTKRLSKAILQARAKLVIKEKIMTHESQFAETSFEVDMNGEDSGCNLISRSVARGQSHQLFRSRINGNTRCNGHSECDAIIMDKRRGQRGAGNYRQPCGRRFDS